MTKRSNNTDKHNICSNSSSSSSSRKRTSLTFYFFPLRSSLFLFSPRSFSQSFVVAVVVIRAVNVLFDWCSSTTLTSFIHSYYLLFVHEKMSIGLCYDERCCCYNIPALRLKRTGTHTHACSPLLSILQNLLFLPPLLLLFLIFFYILTVPTSSPTTSI